VKIYVQALLVTFHLQLLRSEEGTWLKLHLIRLKAHVCAMLFKSFNIFIELRFISSPFLFGIFSALQECCNKIFCSYLLSLLCTCNQSILFQCNI